MLNKIVLMGRLCQDPDLRRTQSGKAVTSFSLAVDRDFKAQSGEKETDFFDIVAWRNTAEFACTYLTKGQLVVVSGSMQNRDWTDKNGNKRRTTEVVADNIYFAGAKPQENASHDNTAKSNVTGLAAEFNEIDEEVFDRLPF